MKKLLTAAGVFTAALLCGCGTAITGISVPADCALTRGDTAVLEVCYTPEQETTDEALAAAAAKLALTWSSADETVATVDGAGTVTAVGPGETEITVCARDGELQSVCRVDVDVPLQSLAAPQELALHTNDAAAAPLNVRLIPADATGVKLTYASSDPAVATVDANGMVTAAGNGECVITARAGDKRAETAVTVTTLAEAIELKTSEGILTVGNDFTVRAALLPETVSQPGLVWNSSDESVATVDQNGRMVARAKGSATITVTSADGAASAQYALTVKAVKCEYCGKEGHAAASCPQKAADQKAAAQQAARQQAAAQAAQQAAEQAAAQTPAEAPAETPAADPAPQEQPAEAPAADPAPAGEDHSMYSAWWWENYWWMDPNYEGHGEYDPEAGMWYVGICPDGDKNYIIPGQCFGDWDEAECP